MAKLKPIIIDNWGGGWAKDYSLSNSASVAGTVGQYARSSAVTLFRDRFPGQLAPGETFSALADTNGYVDALPINGVTDSAGNSHVILENGKLVTVTNDAVAAQHATAHGAHTNLVGEDILNYRNATDEYTIFSYRDDTDWEIGRLAKSTGTYTDNWLSGLTTQTADSGASARTANKGNPGKMWIGPDGIIYRTNGPYIMSHDPATTTVNYGALLVGHGWTTMAGCAWRNYSAIIAYKAVSYLTAFTRSQCRLFLWNGYSTQPNFIYELPDNYATAIQNDGGLLKIFTQGRDGQTRIWGFEGSGDPQVIAKSAQIGVSPRQGSLEYFKDTTQFANATIGIMALDGKSLHATNSVTATDIGMLKNLNSNNLYVGLKVAGTPATYNISKISYAGWNNTANITLCLSQLPPKSTITGLDVYFSQFSADSSVTFSLFKDYTTASVGGAADQLYTIVNAANYPMAATDLMVHIKKTITDVTAYYLKITWSHADASKVPAIIRSIVIHTEDSEKG